MGVDDKTFERLLIRYRPVALKIASLYDHQNRQDIVQIANLRVWKGRKRLQSEERFQPWYYQAVKNTAIDYHRLSYNKPFLPLLQSVASPENIQHGIERQEEVQEAIDWVLREISVTFEPTIVYWLEHGCSLAEASDRTGKYRHSVNVALHRARKRRKENQHDGGRTE